MAINLDFSNVEDKNFDPVPADTYLVKVNNAEETVSQAGNEMINVTFEIAEGEYAGRKIFDNFVLMEKTLWKLKQFLVAIGIDVSEAVDLDVEDLIGTACEARVKIRQDKGYDPRNTITKFTATDEIVM